MQEFIIHFMERFGYLGIALMIAVENIFPPIPSEVILTFGGFMTTKADMNVWLVTLFATIGSVIGALVLYGVGYLVTPKRLGKIIDKWGKFLHVKKEDIQKAEKWFNHNGSITVFFCRFIPIVRSLISIPAGMSHMSLGRFLIYTVLGTSVWNLILVHLGAVAGDNWETIVESVSTYSHIILTVMAVAGGIFLIWFLLRRQKDS